MAGFKLAEAVVYLSVDNTKLDAGIAAAKTQVNTFANLINRGFGAGFGFSAATIGIEAAIHGFKNLVHAGMELEESQVRLHTALDLAGNGALALESHFDSLAATMAGKLNIAANETREVLAYLTTVGIPINSIEDMTKAAAGLAFVLHTDLKGGAINLERALAGNFGQLQRSLPSLVQFKDNAQKLAFVLEVSGKGLEAVGRQQQTAAGHTRTMDTAILQLTQSLSTALGPTTIKAADTITTLAQSFTSGTRQALALSHGLNELGVAFSILSRDKAAQTGFQARITEIEEQYQRLLKKETEVGKVGFDPTNIHAFTKQAKDLHATLASINSLEGFWKKAQIAALGKGGDGDTTDTLKKLIGGGGGVSIGSLIAGTESTVAKYTQQAVAIAAKQAKQALDDANMALNNARKAKDLADERLTIAGRGGPDGGYQMRVAQAALENARAADIVAAEKQVIAKDKARLAKQVQIQGIESNINTEAYKGAVDAAKAKVKAYYDYLENIKEGRVGGSENLENADRGGLSARMEQYANGKYQTDKALTEFGSEAARDKATAIYKAQLAWQNKIVKQKLPKDEATKSYQEAVDAINQFYDPKIAQEQVVRSKVFAKREDIRDAQALMGRDETGKKIKVESDNDRPVLDTLKQIRDRLPGLGGFPEGE